MRRVFLREKGTLLPKRTSRPSNRPRVEREERGRICVVVVGGCGDGDWMVGRDCGDWAVRIGRNDSAALWQVVNELLNR